MKRAEVAYQKDRPAAVRLAVKFAPYQTYTPDEAESLAQELIDAAAEARKENER